MSGARCCHERSQVAEFQALVVSPRVDFWRGIMKEKPFVDLTPRR